MAPIKGSMRAAMGRMGRPWGPAMGMADLGMAIRGIRAATRGATSMATSTSTRATGEIIEHPCLVVAGRTQCALLLQPHSCAGPDIIESTALD